MFLFRKIIKYIWPQIKKYSPAFYGVFSIFGLRVVLDSIIRPIYFKRIIDELSNTGIGDRTLVSHQLLLIVLMMIGISFLVLVTARFGKFIMFAFEINMIRELRNFAFQKIERHSQTFFANTFAGSLVTKSRRFVGAFENMFDILIYSFWNVFIILTGVFIVLFIQSKLICLLFIGWIILYLSIVTFFVRKKVKYDLLEAEADSRIGGRLADVFGNILAVKMFSARPREIDSFHSITDAAAATEKKAWFFAGTIDILQGIMIFIAQSVLLYIMIKLWLRNQISTGTVVLVQTYMVIIFDRLWDLGNSLTRFMKSAADMKEMLDIFDIIPSILDPKHPEPLEMKNGHLVFNAVSFKYQEGQEEIFSNFNLDIKPGERIGLVGHSGAGKSTVTKLLLRFADVTGGNITIDGQDIRNVMQDDLRSVISYVPQEPILFHRSVRENMAYGKPDATDEEIIAVAQKAHAHEFIARLPHGYDTRVGERGVKLSGGERQRVAIARAMLKNAPVLILDEATSSLDSVSESYIQEAFQELMKGKTTIVIAHRLSTIQKMDRIVVLEDGAIIEEGTHRQLLRKKGVYANLWEHQSGGFIE